MSARLLALHGVAGTASEGVVHVAEKMHGGGDVVSDVLLSPDGKSSLTESVGVELHEGDGEFLDLLQPLNPKTQNPKLSTLNTKPCPESPIPFN